MRRFYIATLLALLSASVIHAAEKGKHLFILSGQSNMVGLKPEISFTPAIEAEFGKDNVIVVKDAKGSQPIRQWFKEWKPATPSKKQRKQEAHGLLYDKLMLQVKAAIKDQTIQTVTFVWMQGERDAREKHGEVYAASFKGVIAQLSKDLDHKDINFVIGRLSDFDMDDKVYPHWTMVRDAQVKLAEDNARGAWVDTDDLNDKKHPKTGATRNDLHYSKDGYKTLGRRFAKEAIALAKK